jgi:hypothetical protein
VNENNGQSLPPTNASFLQLKDANGNFILSNVAGVPRALQFGLRVKF